MSHSYRSKKWVRTFIACSLFLGSTIAHAENFDLSNSDNNGRMCKINLVNFDEQALDPKILKEIQMKKFIVIQGNSRFKLELDSLNAGLGTKWVFDTDLPFLRPLMVRYEKQTVSLYQDDSIISSGTGSKFWANLRSLPQELYPEANRQRLMSIIQAIRHLETCKE